MSAVFNLPCFHQLYKEICQPTKLVVPGTAETASTNITAIQNTHENDDLLDTEEVKQNTLDIDFHGLYYKYANEQNIEIRKTVAAALHEGFKLTGDDEDCKKLQVTFCELLEEDNKEVAAALAENIDVIIKKYANKHAISQVIVAEDQSPNA